MDTPSIRRRKLWCLVTSKSVVLPAVAGIGALAVSALAGQPFGWVGLASLGWGVAAACLRWLTDSEGLARQAADQVRRQRQTEHLAYLKSLRRRLRRDRDPRTGKSLRRLRRIYDRLMEAGLLDDPSVSPVLADVNTPAQQLYQSCIQLLEKSLALWKAAQGMATEEARRDLLESREQLLTEVHLSIERLDRTIDSVRLAVLRDEKREDEHARLREELDEGLAVAQRVQQRMDELERGIREGDDTGSGHG